ncbi:hypothetical protein GCM10023084_80520 [Streptomyces lacrimifluminis]|uniref:Uncharacterized protein n=1 Tax=Streptomyces lacrimifluminis TaxID=1500077 RepID=A0A917PCQ6_9ACTN|nr:hypothetical protein [Streptomyces lacrimifluminis]GGJ70934.1 hypothetical protein GCM10012282_79730 [Streptomyces lacrimifluminis]
MPSSYTVVLTVLAVAVAITVSLLAALAAGLLARADGASPAAAVSRGGIAFAATLTLLALMVTTVAGLLT